MQTYIQRGRLKVAAVLDNFLSTQALPDSGVSEQHFWQSFENILTELTPENTQLLKRRDELQSEIDNFCVESPATDLEAYKSFLQEIGYLQPEPGNFEITTSNVDAEIATMAGPQLVVPINNARYALNAVNARWGSLYDAVYGTDVLPEAEGAEKTSGYNPIRGQQVVAYAKNWLDRIAPLDGASHADVRGYAIADGQLQITLADNRQTVLNTPSQFRGFDGDEQAPCAILLCHNQIHIELQIDRTHPIGKDDPAGLKDVLVESALTTIMDCEDSVAAVDAEDKTLVYQNWLGLMQGSLSTKVNKGGKQVTRAMESDRSYLSAQGHTLSLPGRSLMFVRNVGHLMTNDAILLDDNPIYEGLMDAMITALIGKHDLLGNSPFKNSQTGSIYIVKPKMHGPQEVAFADKMFSQVEAALGLAPFTLKMGIMDEERRTSVNLKACIHSAKHRAVFINTGFLDRTGDEIHTSMLLGAFAQKAELKARPWINAYEKANVIAGLQTGMSGKAQIGKGMWPIPDQMAKMMETKTAHPQSGANTAWVPSPTAATLHALHYHQINVFDLREGMKADNSNTLDDILTIPLMDTDQQLSSEQIQRELDNNVQGILGYVVRWVHQGIGCSKVPDINNVGLMEDRATLRISSQHICNWLVHGIVDIEQVTESMLKMAELVDKQNAGDPEYIPMMPTPENSIAYQAASALIFEGKSQPNGYTEPVLHAKRKQMKAQLASH